MALQFKVEDFVSETHPAYNDREGDSPYRLMITSLPTYGTLYKSGVLVSDNEVMLISDANNLSYERDTSKLEAHTDTFNFQIEDTGSGQYSNIGTITINATTLQSPPTVDDNSAILSGKTHTFDLSSFTKNFSDPNGDGYSDVVLKSITNIPQLSFEGGITKVGDTFVATNSGKLKYTLPDKYVVYDGVLYEFDKNMTTLIVDMEIAGYKLLSNEAGVMTFGKNGQEYDTLVVEGTLVTNDALCFDFVIKDNSTEKKESNVAEFCLIPQGNINVRKAYINQPPTVGDNTFSTQYSVTINFTKEDFISGTTPPYNDVEGDVPTTLKVISVPSTGSLLLNGVVVSVNRELTMGELSSLKYKPDDATETAYQTSFTFQVKDAGSNAYSNTGTISISVDEKIASPPIVSDNSANLTSKSYTFALGSFTKNFSDADGDSYSDVVLKSLPNVPALSLLGATVTVGTTFQAINSSGLKFNLPDNYAVYNNVLYQFSDNLNTIITNMNNQNYVLQTNSNGTLTFVNKSDNTDVVTITGTVIPNSDLCFNFAIKDDSQYKLESSEAEFCLIPQGNINIKEVYTNNPPDIGDNKVVTPFNKIFTFERKHFIEDTKPAYSDPENDAPLMLKVLSLPVEGTLRLNGVDVVVNQEIPITEIEAKKLVYVPNSSRTDIPTVNFDFTVSDVGSQQYA